MQSMSGVCVCVCVCRAREGVRTKSMAVGLWSVRVCTHRASKCGAIRARCFDDVLASEINQTQRWLLGRLSAATQGELLRGARL
jgi:hypothetical protein|mmetsp:Transcript_62733/g.172313  ORF Transcript_62733/g.172313 Transcript_62733/m.172313 type:complete len:84 (-) Transcript_62733:70-321(-)